MERSVQQLTLSEVTALVGGDLQGNPDKVITSLATLESANNCQLSFLSNSRYTHKLGTTKAAAVLIKRDCVVDAPCDCIIVDDPYLAYAKLSHFFDWREPLTAGVASSATVDKTAYIHPSAVVSDGVRIGRNTHVAAGVYLGPNCVVGNDCLIGANTRLEASVTLYGNVQLGERTIVHAGAVIGADGFGFAPSKQGWHKICQLGGVRIGDDVEVGAGTTIDRGALDNTVIGDGVKLDNLIQIAHNVQIGEETAIAGCTAVAGSTRIGRRCTIAGLSGITGHLSLADNTHVTAMTLVSKSITLPGQTVSSGTGQEAHRQWKRNVVRFRQLDDMAKRIQALEHKLEKFSTEG
jgi:UDP-3-O-[3-hydroxymyristoyl] glucosamine N-acyltransferase